MPMKSKAQRRYLWAKHPDLARKFEDETPQGAKLPQHVTKEALRKAFFGDEKADDMHICKVDVAQKQIFGWAYITHTPDGEVWVDRQGDFVDDPEELAKAAYDYVLNSRQGDLMHTEVPVASLIESFAFTPEKMAKMGLPEGLIQPGWWLGFQVHDDAVWSGVESGMLGSFSVGGAGVRTPVEE